MDPRDWIYGFLNHVPSLLSKPLRWVADRIFSILDDGVTFAKWIKSGVTKWYATAISIAASLVTLGAEVVTTFTWVVKTFIPQRVAAAINTVKQWASPLINAALNTAKSLVKNLTDWAKAQLNSLLSALTALRNWATARIDEIKAKLKGTVDVWFDRLTHPDKMAAWLIGAMLGQLFRFAYANRDRIATWFLRASPAFTAWLVRQLDDVIGRLL